jgi:hypothetical protein
MKLKINQDQKFWIKMLMSKFGLTKKEAIAKLNESKN